MERDQVTIYGSKNVEELREYLKCEVNICISFTKLMPAKEFQFSRYCGEHRSVHSNKFGRVFDKNFDSTHYNFVGIISIDWSAWASQRMKNDKIIVHVETKKRQKWLPTHTFLWIESNMCVLRTYWMKEYIFSLFPSANSWPLLLFSSSSSSCLFFMPLPVHCVCWRERGRGQACWVFLCVASRTWVSRARGRKKWYQHSFIRCNV